MSYLELLKLAAPEAIVLVAADVREVTGSEPGPPEKVTPVPGGASWQDAGLHRQR